MKGRIQDFLIEGEQKIIGTQCTSWARNPLRSGSRIVGLGEDTHPPPDRLRRSPPPPLPVDKSWLRQWMHYIELSDCENIFKWRSFFWFFVSSFKQASIQCVPIKSKSGLSVKYLHWHAYFNQTIWFIIKCIFNSFIWYQTHDDISMHDWKGTI